jgi:hypothetical protein
MREILGNCNSQNAKVRWEKSTQLIKSNQFVGDRGKMSVNQLKLWKRKTLNLTRSGTR